MEFLDLGKKPVSEAHPAGTDARYEPEYEDLQHEIDKLSSATAGGGVDWKNVLKLSSTILIKLSKDMKVASYLGVALIHLKGVEGISAGTQIILDMVSTYWDSMFPAKKRVRGRFNAISWWADNAENCLKDYEGDEFPQAVVDLLTSRINELDQVLSEKSEDAPMLNRLAGYAARLPVVAEPEPEEQAAPAAQQDAQQDTQQVAQPKAAPPVSQAPPGPVVTAPGSIASEDDYRAMLDAGLANLSSVADYLLEHDPANSMGYRFRRIVAWTSLTSAPPAENGLSLIPPPDSSVREAIFRQLENKDFSDAVQAAESRIGQFLFWLDLSRITAVSLEGLGSAYDDARRALEHEVELFIRRLPGIERLSFSDGTPFADARTKAWLKSLGSAGSPVAEAGQDAGGETGKVLTEAAKLAQGKKIFDAVKLIQDSYNRTPSYLHRFLLRMGMIRILTDEGQGTIAHVHVEELLERIDEFHLEEWDQELALRGLVTAYEALIAEGGDEAVSLAGRTLQRIGRISPAEALKINGLN